MALFDVDKDGERRAKPSPNSHDDLPSSTILAKGTNSTNYVGPNSNLSSLQSGKNGQFTIVGSGTMTNTSSVLLANSPGAGTFNDFTSMTVVSQPHGLPYKPIVVGSILSTSGNTYYMMPFSRSDYSSGATSALWFTLLFGSDDTNIYVVANGMVWGGGWNLSPGLIFKYYLQYQTPN